MCFAHIAKEYSEGESRMARRDIIVIGASSGGIETLREIVRDLPANLPAAVFVVVHISANANGVLPSILNRAGKLPAVRAHDGDSIQTGRIYVAAPDFHLLLRPASIRLTRGPKENNHRPAIDATFRTAARYYAHRVIGVVLSGSLDDGTAGLFEIKKCGGLAIVQDPEDALFPQMPRSALAAVKVDYCLPKSEIPKILAQIAQEDSLDEFTAPCLSKQMEKEAAIEEFKMSEIQNQDKPGKPSVFGCPDCGGTLWELNENEILRFRCRVGHAYTAESLMSQQGDRIEEVLWSALRALEEKAALSRRVAARARGHNNNSIAAQFEAEAEKVEDQAKVIHDLIAAGNDLDAPTG
jgi:two-component system chemotaxis response regulator CheB